MPDLILVTLLWVAAFILVFGDARRAALPLAEPVRPTS
jgi:hypothetical protein